MILQLKINFRFIYQIHNKSNNSRISNSRHMKYYPGDIVPDSGIYDEFNSNGAKVDQVTNVKGHIFPPTLRPGNYYMIFMKARNRTLEK